MARSSVLSNGKSTVKQTFGSSLYIGEDCPAQALVLYWQVDTFTVLFSVFSRISFSYNNAINVVIIVVVVVVIVFSATLS